MSLLNYALEQLLADEEILIAYDEQLCISKFSQTLTSKARDCLFKIVFNQRLFAFLASRIAKITDLAQLKSTSSLSVFGVQRYGNNNPDENFLNIGKKPYKEGSRARVPVSQREKSSSKSQRDSNGHSDVSIDSSFLDYSKEEKLEANKQRKLTKILKNTLNIKLELKKTYMIEKQLKDQTVFDEASPFYTGIKDFASAAKKVEAEPDFQESSHSFKILEGDDGQIEIEKKAKLRLEKYSLSKLNYF